MCVAITMMPGATLDQDELFRMGNANGDGFGVAWADDGLVSWYKTLQYDIDDLLQQINGRKDMPRLVHFRLSTVGGVKVDLCHPFEIGPLASGRATGHGQKVLIHNGHWSRSGDIFDILAKEDALPDKGPWSDTRLAAMMASWDEDWLSTVTGKVATLDSDGNIKLYGDWTDLREGIKVSNKYWESHTYDYRKSGGNRNWMGWGWSEYQWRQKEAHDEAKKKAEEAAKAAEKDKNSGQEKKEEEKRSTGVGVGGAQGGSVPNSLGRSYGNGPLPGGGAGGGGSVAGQEGQAGGKDEKEVQVKKPSSRYDYTPWHDKATGQWWQVDPERSTDIRYVIRGLKEDKARQILEQIAAASSTTGDSQN